VALYRYTQSVEWTEPDGSWQVHRTPEGTFSLVRAVSLKHATNKVFRRVESLPCYADRAAAGLPVSATVTVYPAEG
jgi:hypothetical protein